LEGDEDEGPLEMLGNLMDLLTTRLTDVWPGKGPEKERGATMKGPRGHFFHGGDFREFIKDFQS
jgi:hypothetical protein